VGAVAAARWGPHRAAGRTMLFTAVALAPALHLVPLPRFSSPHYAHLATVGLGMLAALALVRWAPQAGHWGRAARAAAGVWLAVAAAVTLAGGSRFEDDLTLFGPEVQADPGFVEGHSELGLYFARRGDVSRASAAFEEALRPRPGVIAYRDDVMIFVNLASVRLSQGRIGEADALLARAEALAPASQAEGIAFNRAAVAARRGDDEAVVRLLWPFGPSSTRPETLMLLARSLGRQGRREDAVQTLRKALPVVDAAQRNRLEQLLASTGR
jgi:tetratricopeptide (TPR) repeat protein